MKRYIVLITASLLLVNFSFSQNRLESNPSLLGVTIGDDFSQWEKKLKYEGSKENLNKFNYILNEEKTIAGTPIERIDFVFNKASKKLEWLVITTKKFKSGVWDEKQYEPIFELLQQEFGKPSNYNTDEESMDLSYFWDSKNYALVMKYDWGGSSLSEYTNKVDIILTLKTSFNSSEKL